MIFRTFDSISEFEISTEAERQFNRIKSQVSLYDSQSRTVA